MASQSYLWPSQDNNQPQVTHVSVSSVPPLSVHGSGVTTEGSREDAAANALKELKNILTADNLKSDFPAVSTQPEIKEEPCEKLPEVKNE